MSSQPPSRTRFYRDTANGKVMGVCAGIADYTGMDVNLVRVMLLAAIVLGSGSPILIYFIAGWMTPKKPRELISGDAEEQRFWQGVRASPTQTARNIRSRIRTGRPTSGLPSRSCSRPASSRRSRGVSGATTPCFMKSSRSRRV